MAERLAELTDRMRRIEQRNEFLKYTWLLAKNYGDVFQASIDADKLFSRTDLSAQVLKTAIAAGSTLTTGWANELADYKLLTSEWISLLSSRTIIGRLPFRKVNFNTRTLVQTTPGSAGWVSEASPIPASRMSLSGAQVNYSKIAGIVFFTRESLEIWNANTANQINNAMLNTLGRYSDTALLAPELSLTGSSPASITNGLTPTTSTGSGESGITANLKTMIAAHTDAGADPLDLAIIMHPSTALHLATTLSTGGSRAFPDVGVNGGTIFGIVTLTTPGAITLGSPSERVIAVINAAGILIADDAGIDVSTAKAGSLQMTDAPGAGPQTTVSMFQTHSCAMKFVRTLSFLRADDSAVSYMRVGY